jgi:Fic family protein
MDISLITANLWLGYGSLFVDLQKALVITHNPRKIDPIILTGFFQRQCVIIHPFIDGNGRTTRLLTTTIFRKGRAGFVRGVEL